MAFDREKAFANAERLFKQAKAREAIDECRRIADDAPRDLLVLNRVGDLLARCGRPVEAIGYYEKIAEQFSASGFYPKAIAILKKIVISSRSSPARRAPGSSRPRTPTRGPSSSPTRAACTSASSRPSPMS